MATPLTKVVSRSSTGPRLSSRSFPSHSRGSLNVVRNQTTPSKPGSPASSQYCGRRIFFQPESSNEGSDHIGFAAEPRSFFAHHVSVALSNSAGGLLDSAQVFSRSL